MVERVGGHLVEAQTLCVCNSGITYSICVRQGSYESPVFVTLLRLVPRAIHYSGTLGKGLEGVAETSEGEIPKEW
jgi:hypothetical protein